MTVLLLTHRVPYPPNRGDRIRSFELLKFLAARTSVRLASVSDEPVAAETRRHLAGLCDEVAIFPTSRIARMVRALSSLARGGSATEGHFWSPQLASQLRLWRQQGKFDSVLCYCSGMFRYLRDEAFADLPVVVDLVDVDSLKWSDCATFSRGPKRWLYRLESRRVSRLEEELSGRARAVILVSAAEAALFRQMYPATTVRAATNGVDLSMASETAVPDRLSCVFVGALDYFPNTDGVTWFCRHVWPRVRDEFPDAQFSIVGRNPAVEVNRLNGRKGVRVVGQVADVRPYLQEARVVVVPLQIARGIQNKVLEAMAAAKPIVATPQALTGLQAVDREHAYAASAPGEWVEALRTLFQDRQECRRLGDAARAYVEEHHYWGKCLLPFDEIMHRIAIGGSAATMHELRPAPAETALSSQVSVAAR